MDDVERLPFYPGTLSAHPRASAGARRRAVEDAHAVGGDGVVFRVSRFPIDLYGAHSHISSEVNLDLVGSWYSRPSHVRRRLPPILQPVVAPIEYDAAFAEIASHVATGDAATGAQLDGTIRQPGVQEPRQPPRRERLARALGRAHELAVDENLRDRGHARHLRERPLQVSAVRDVIELDRDVALGERS